MKTSKTLLQVIKQKDLTFQQAAVLLGVQNNIIHRLKHREIHISKFEQHLKTLGKQAVYFASKNGQKMSTSNIEELINFVRQFGYFKNTRMYKAVPLFSSIEKHCKRVGVEVGIEIEEA